MTRTTVKPRVGLSGKSDRKRGHGPNHSVAKSKSENTDRFESSREARTVEPDRAAVRGKVEGADDDARVAVTLPDSGDTGARLLLYVRGIAR